MTEPLHCVYCGGLDWTVKLWGRETHKESCPHRTDPWYQASPAADKVVWEHVGWALQAHPDAPCQWYLAPRIDPENKPNTGSNEPPCPPWERVYRKV